MNPLKTMSLAGFTAIVLIGCGQEDLDYGPAELDFAGSDIDSAPVIAEKSAKDRAPKFEDGKRKIGFKDLSLEELGEEGMEDLLDAQLYPEDYSEEERAFPVNIQELHETEVVMRGYMIPSLQEDGKVFKFMLVGDLLACCFGTAPQADQWVKVVMAEGEASDYFAFSPILVHGRFWIQGIEDEAGYASGCYHMEATKVELAK